MGGNDIPWHVVCMASSHVTKYKMGITYSCFVEDVVGTRFQGREG